NLVCQPTQPAVLNVGASMVCTGTHSVTQSDLNTGLVYNLATADSDQTPPSNDDVTVPGSQTPLIQLTKTATETSYSAVGNVIHYLLVAKNTGNVTLNNVQISDPLLKTLTSCTPALGSTLAPNATMTCSGSYTITQDDLNAGKVDNTAKATGTPPTGPD